MRGDREAKFEERTLRDRYKEPKKAVFGENYKEE